MGCVGVTKEGGIPEEERDPTQGGTSGGTFPRKPDGKVSISTGRGSGFASASCPPAWEGGPHFLRYNQIKNQPLEPKERFSSFFTRYECYERVWKCTRDNFLVKLWRSRDEDQIYMGLSNAEVIGYNCIVCGGGKRVDRFVELQRWMR